MGGPMPWYAHEGVNLPNAITVVRIGLVPVFAYLYLSGKPGAALAVFAVAALSDGLDGLLARLLDQRTRIGAILDPVADKVLAAVALILLVFSGVAPLWLLLVSMLRDGVVFGVSLTSKVTGRFVEAAPTRVSKYGTFTLLLTIFLALGNHAGVMGDALLPYLQVVAILAGLCLVIASFQYLFRWRALLKG